MRLLIINSSPDTCEMLEEFFQREGWETAVMPLRPLREQVLTGHDLMTSHHPDAILGDVAIPYEANWVTLQRLRQDPAVTVPVVITTTNEAVVRRLVGPEERLQEVVGQPYDLDQLQDAILTAMARADSPRPLPKVERRHGDRRVRDRRR
jgi:DNA-binding response OmpR family regulator